MTQALAVAHKFEHTQALKVRLVSVVMVIVLFLLAEAVGGYMISGLF